MADDNPQLLADIRLALRHAQLRPVYAVDLDRRRIATRPGRAMLEDLGRVSGRANLSQAIVLRLLTPRGELAPLGHPEYGSRLHELIGERNTDTTRNRIRLFILEALAQEPRVEEVLELEVTPYLAPRSDERGRHLVVVRLAVKPIGEAERLDLGPFTLEL